MLQESTQPKEFGGCFSKNFLLDCVNMHFSSLQEIVFKKTVDDSEILPKTC